MSVSPGHAVFTRADCAEESCAAAPSSRRRSIRETVNPEAPPGGRWTKARRARFRAATEHREQLDDTVPKCVKKCHGTGGRDWWIYTWRKDNPTACVRIPYLCQSWRCPSCRQHEAHVQYARMQQAAAKLEPLGWIFITLTVRRGATADPRGSTDAAYRALSAQSGKFLKRLRRWQESKHWKALENQWIATVEAHRSGWPHLHMVIHSPQLAKWLRKNEQEENLFPPELQAHLVECGWGPRSTIEVARERDKLMSYLVKLSGEHDQALGELAKLTQLPTVAPKRMRRLRAGKRFLPPRIRSNDEWTGTLVRHRFDQRGLLEAQSVHAHREDWSVRQVCEHEEQLQYTRRKGDELPEPPVLHLPLTRTGQRTPLLGVRRLRTLLADVKVRDG